MIRKSQKDFRLADVADPRVRESLLRVTQSDLFAHSGRLRDFLIYVVEETVADRSGSIRAKTIAQDVYLRNQTQVENGDNVVRVDAGRLRRKLAEYYATDGEDDPVWIHMEVGGYAPTFEDRECDNSRGREKTPSQQNRTSPGKPLTYITIGVTFAVVIAAFANFLWPQASVVPSLNSRGAERQALAEKSTATLLADNLCTQGRGLLFPIANPEIQKLATQIFRQAIATDEGYACGYAGAAHSTATLAILAPSAEQKAQLTAIAEALAKDSIERAPKEGWSQSAAAWAAFASGDFDRAVTLSARALALSPRDGNIMDFHATISVLTGDFQEALRISAPALPRESGSDRFARLNIRAVASFHLGNYETAIQLLQDAIQSGDPVSALTLLFLTVSHQAAGNEATAKRLVQEIAQTWPDFDPELLARNYYADPKIAEQVIGPLTAAGWQGTTR